MVNIGFLRIDKLNASDATCPIVSEFNVGIHLDDPVWHPVGRDNIGTVQLVHQELRTIAIVACRRCAREPRQAVVVIRGKQQPRQMRQVGGEGRSGIARSPRHCALPLRGGDLLRHLQHRGQPDGRGKDFVRQIGHPLFVDAR